MLFTKNLKNIKLKKKLFYKFTKFFEIKNVVKSQTYRLCLFDQWKIHFVFYVFLLKLYYINANIVFFAEMILMSENKEYKVKNILKNIKKQEKFYYLVRWKKFLFYKNNWIFKYYLTNAQNILKRYHKHKLFITMIFKAKKSRFRIQKKNKAQAMCKKFVKQTSIERWKHNIDCDKMKENDYNSHLMLLKITFYTLYIKRCYCYALHIKH